MRVIEGNGKKSRKKLLFFVPVWIVLSAVFGSVTLTHLERRDRYAAEQARLSSELDAVTKEAEELANQIRYYKSDYYIEKIAREQLGLLYPDEIVFSVD